MTFLLAAGQGRTSVASHALGTLVVALLYLAVSVAAAAVLFGVAGAPPDAITIPELPLGSIGAAATLAILLLPSIAVLRRRGGGGAGAPPPQPPTLVRAAGPLRWRRAMLAAGVWAGCAAAYETVSFLLYPGSYTWTFDAARFVPLLVVAVLLVPLQSAAEELLFRGYLMQGLGWWLGRGWAALLVSSALFAAMHLGNPELEQFGRGFFLYYMGIGVVFGLATLLDDGLEVAIGAHAANNLWGALVVSFPGSVLDTPALVRMEGVPPEVMVALGGATALTALVVLAILLDWRGPLGWRAAVSG